MKIAINKVVLSISILLLAQPLFATHHETGEKNEKAIIGYDTTEGTKAPLYAGSLDTIAVWTKYMQAHEDKDLNAIRNANAEGFEAWTSDGSFIDSTDAQMTLLKEWFAASDPKWTHMYSIANEFTGKDGKLQQWVTTGWDLVETIDGKKNKRREVFDVLIENGKVKTIYIAARPIIAAD
jgi:hypothetical protein